MNRLPQRGSGASGGCIADESVLAGAGFEDPGVLGDFNFA